MEWPEQIAVFCAGREFLAEFVAGFRAHAKRGAGLKGDDAIAGGIAEQRGIQLVSR